MSKKVNWLPNLRVDLTDIEYGTSTYTESLQKERTKNFLNDPFPRVSDGFRIEIADQTASPGLFTVHNGSAYSTDGTYVSNTDDVTAQRSGTITATATYYVEIEYLETPGDSALRGVWDPTFDNGLDTSGDEIPDGKEYSQNVATRITRDWHIVSPISTSGFAFSSSSVSQKIPVAILTVAGGVITGVTTSPARSCLVEGINSGVTSFRVINSSLMPASFTATLDVGGANQETVTVTANDTASGILSLSSGTGFAHLAGARVAVAGATPTQFLTERTISSPVLATAVGDARMRFFQGNEEAGFSLSQNPYASTGGGDSQVNTLKEFVDFASSQIRDMKWGSGRASTIGNQAPPASFGAAPRYFDSAGGVMGSRAATVTVGNGTTTWGDFNTTQSGSATAAIQAAHDALPTDGGIIYLKAGVYSVPTTSIAFTKPVSLIGDGPDVSIIRSTGSVPCLTLATMEVSSNYSGYFFVKGVKFDLSSSTATYNVTCVGNSRIYAQDCIFRGGLNAGSFTLTYSTFNACQFLTATTSAGIAMTGILQNCNFTNCLFQTDLNNAGSRCLVLGAASTHNKFDSCDFYGGSAATTGLVSLNTTATSSSFVACRFHGGTSVTTALLPGTSTSSVTLSGCTVDTAAGLGTFTSGSNIRIDSCDVTPTTDGVSFTGCTEVIVTRSKFNFLANRNALLINAFSSKILVSDCLFTQTTNNSTLNGRAIDLVDVTGLLVNNCEFDNVDIGIKTDDITFLSVKGCQFTSSTASVGMAGVYCIGSLNKSVISSCLFANITNEVAPCVGIYTVDADSLIVDACEFRAIGTGSADAAYGVFIDTLPGIITLGVSVTNCVFDSIIGVSDCCAIKANTLKNAVLNNNNIRNIGSTGNLGTFTGILVGSLVNGSVSANTINSIGTSSSLTGGSAAIKIGASGAGTTQTQDVSVNGNVISNIATGNSATYGIYLSEAGIGVSLANNVFNVSTTIYACIEVAASASSFDISNVSVNGNIMRGGQNSVVIILTDTSPLQEGRLSVTNNQFYEFDSRAVYVSGNGGSSTDQFSCIVSNNLIQTSLGADYGIYVDFFSNVSAVGNNVYFSSTTASQVGIYFGSVFFGNVASNMIYSNAISGSGIYLANAQFLLITGNNVAVDSSDAGMYLGANQYCVANTVRNTGAGAKITNSNPALTQTKAFTDADSFGLPVNSTDVGLNKRG